MIWEGRLLIRPGQCRPGVLNLRPLRGGANAPGQWGWPGESARSGARIVANYQQYVPTSADYYWGGDINTGFKGRFSKANL